jgi:hypothetical protein
MKKCLKNPYPKNEVLEDVILYQQVSSSLLIQQHGITTQNNTNVRTTNLGISF